MANENPSGTRTKTRNIENSTRHHAGDPRAVNNHLVEFHRYFLLSLAALALDFSLLFILAEVLGVHYLIANAASFLTGAIVAYIGSIVWVFAVRRITNPRRECAIFVAIGIAGLGVNEAVLWIGVQNMGLSLGPAKVAAAAASFAFNYLVRKLWLFR